MKLYKMTVLFLATVLVLELAFVVYNDYRQQPTIESEEVYPKIIEWDGTTRFGDKLCNLKEGLCYSEKELTKEELYDKLFPNRE